MTDQKKTIEKKKRTWRKKVAKTATNSLSVQKEIKEAIAQRDARELERLKIGTEALWKRRELLTTDKTSVKKGVFLKTHGLDTPYEGNHTWIDDRTGEIHGAKDLPQMRPHTAKDAAILDSLIREARAKKRGLIPEKEKKRLQGIETPKPGEFVPVGKPYTEEEWRRYNEKEDSKKANQCCFKRFWSWIRGGI